MLTADELTNRKWTIVSKAKFVTWEGSLDKTPQVLDEKPGKHVEIETAVRRFLSANKGKVFSSREVSIAVHATDYIVTNLLEKLYRNDLLKKIHGKRIRYQVL